MKPRISRAASGLRASVFASLADRFRNPPPGFLPMHIGDTWKEPPEAARLDRLDWAAAPPLYKYSHPFGVRSFMEAVAEKVATRNRIPATPDWLQITNGATHALSCAVHTVLDPGDEVLVLAPYWPLIKGVIATMGAVPVEVRFTDRLYADPGLDVLALLEEARTPRTAAVYFGNPNNPDGKVLTRAQLSAIAEFCRRHDLFCLADEVYEDYAYDGREHVSIASLEGMAERTASVYSFSKSYGMAGARIGYVVAHPDVMGSLRRVANHMVYNVSAAHQYSAHQALLHGDAFLAEARRDYAEARGVLAEALGARVPDGAVYVFLECESGEAAWDLLNRALDRGVALAPGADFGPSYAAWLRICFTGVPLEGVRRGGEILRELMGRS